MKTVNKLFTCLIMAVAFLATQNVATPVACSAPVQVSCECGNTRCGGCERGRLLAAMRGKVASRVANVNHSADCGCQQCGDVPVYVESPPVYIESPAVAVAAPCVTCQPAVVHQQVAACNADCGCNACRIRRPRRKLCRIPRVKCPECECDQCVLKVEQADVKKTCFKVEQKEVCIPAVTLPWQKCCPKTTSKMRVVNVLKKHTYKCKECSYSWNVHEPEVAQPEAAEPAAAAAPAEAVAPPTGQDEVQGTLDQPALELPGANDVPQPPMEPVQDAVIETAK